MSKPTNKLSSEPVSEPTYNQMNDPNHYKEEPLQKHCSTDSGIQPLQKHCCTDLGIQSILIFTSEKTNGRQQSTHSANSDRGRLASLLLSGHKSVGIKPRSLYLKNNSRLSRSFIDDVLIDLWQCQMEINKVKSMKTAQSVVGSMCKASNLVGTAMIKNQSKLKTVLPLNLKATLSC